MDAQHYTGPERRRAGRPRIGDYRISVTLPPDLQALANDIAERRGISVSSVLRIVFARYANSRSVNPPDGPTSPTL
jgi:hypothetical protein